MISLMLMAETVHGQSMGGIDYRILEKEVKVPIGYPRIVINAEFRNTSELDFLIPGITNMFIMPPTLDFSWDSEDKDAGGGNLFFLLTEHGERVEIWQDIGGNHDDTTSFAISLTKAYVDNLACLLKGEKVIMQMVIDLSKAGPLKVGKYSFYLIYSSGKLASNVVKLNRPTQNACLQGIVFEGYVKSKCIPLEIY